MKKMEPRKLDVLQSFDFFTDLREAMRRLGLRGDEKFGVGIYFVATSRIFGNPLRLNLREQTEGGANYIVRRVAKLLRPGSFLEISSGSNQEWSRFKEKPDHKTLYLPEGDSTWNEGTSVRFETTQNQISRVTPMKKDGRVVEQREEVDAAFASISAEHHGGMSYAPRWLTMSLDKPPQPSRKAAFCIPNPVTPLGQEELAQWHQVQKLARLQAQRGIVLPDWTDLVVEEICKADRAAWHLPAFLPAWRTMCVLRFLHSSKGILRDAELHAEFEDFAATGLLLRGLFREGSWFPSATKVFHQLARQRTGVIHPVTGKGITYKPRVKRTEWAPLIEV